MKGYIVDPNNPKAKRTAPIKAFPSNFGDGLYSLEVKQGAGLYEYIDDNVLHTLKATPGILRAIYIWDAGTNWTINIEDGTTSITGGAIAVAGLNTIIEMNVKMTTSIKITMAAGAPAGKMLAIYD